MNVEQLIKELSSDSRPTQPAAKPFALFARWFLYSVAYLSILLVLFGVRDDISEKWGPTMFTYEILSLFAMIVTVAISAILLSYPDMYQKKFLVYLPIIPTAIFLYVMYLSYQEPNIPEPEIEEGIDCFIYICLFSLGPVLILLNRLRRQASTHPRVTTELAIIASVSFGALVFRFSETSDSVSHIILSHYLPITGLALLGVALGKKLLRW